VVSNNDGRLHQQLATAGLAGYVTAIVDSAAVGGAKPDPGIFLHAAAALGARLEECVMIGDDPYRGSRSPGGKINGYG
jgi:putative hydrolase of the HAD superfamily